ncbi:MAG TPA: hypothetical protein VK432_03905 [Stellaceae bacterium]|nr:hypothetical protein [Stellaceae bacterium]
MVNLAGDYTWRLLDREQLIWSGRPGQGLRLTSRDAFLIPFSLLWGGFAVFWESSVVRSNGPAFFRFWGVPFLAIGAYLVFGRFILDAWARAKTRYAVTNQRVLIVREWPFQKYIALGIDRLPQIELSEQANGRGTILFGEQAPMWGRTGWSSWTPSLSATPQFIAIDDARDVFDKIQRAGQPGSSW